MRKGIYGMPLRKSLILVFIVFVVGTGILSSVTVFVSAKIQKHVLDSRTLSFKVAEEVKELMGGVSFKVDGQYRWSPLTPGQKMLYYGSIAVMVLLIIFYVVIGGLLAGSFYYKTKLKEPLQLLAGGLEKITEGDLDFSIGYQSDDEMGKLCAAVEKMAQELRRDKLQIWSLMEGRCALNASVSHDLGTPVTVIKGYLECLRRNIPKGRVTEDAMMDTLGHMQEAVCRLETYIECVRDIQRIDEIKLNLRREKLQPVLAEMESDFENLAGKYGKEMAVCNQCGLEDAFLDKNQFFRIMENIASNALRFAKTRVCVRVGLCNGFLTLAVSDDGPGFLESELMDAAKLFYTTDKSQGNMGLGLYISKVLCEKHGGDIHVGNGPEGGGRIIVRIKVVLKAI